MQQYQQSLTQSDIYPHGVFSKWIGGGNSYWVVLYFALLPILAALPFADSLHADRRSGYVKIFLRAGREGRIIRQNLSLFFIRRRGGSPAAALEFVPVRNAAAKYYARPGCGNLLAQSRVIVG